MKLYLLALRSGAVLIAIAVFIFLAPRPALAASGAYYYGEVISVRACPRIFVVSEKNGFSIIQLAGGSQIVDQDVLAGNLECIGLATVQDISRNNTQVRVIVVDSLLSKTQFSGHLARYCNG